MMQAWSQVRSIKMQNNTGPTILFPLIIAYWFFKINISMQNSQLDTAFRNRIVQFQYISALFFSYSAKWKNLLITIRCCDIIYRKHWLSPAYRVRSQNQCFLQSSKIYAQLRKSCLSLTYRIHSRNFRQTWFNQCFPGCGYGGFF